MAPTELDQWTLEAVKRLLSMGAFERDSFDFKEQLPDSRNAEHKLGLALDCAAFGNSDGGFLIFGVKR
jgi:predicted HTH transcriptional regulator